MLERLASGGLVTVLLITFLALGYARVLRAPRWVYTGISMLVVVTIIGSQFLPSENIFRIRIADSFGFGGRFMLWSSPVIAYGVLIWWIRRKTRAREGNDGS
ncbi:MAG: hypothetical protein COA53_07020 [Rhodobacteraceae bacterium]|nr:MAG: hypothetical protein COA53_07020 [Paracoccaceae bacterium]